MVEDVGQLLSKAGLEHFSQNFIDQGFTTAESLTILTMQDYGKFGLIHMEDKRKLFQVIQQKKQMKNRDMGGNKRMSSVIARLTSSEKKSKEKRETPPEPTPPNTTYFNRATFLRRSFNKTKGTDIENPFQRSKQMSARGRCPSAQPAVGKKPSLSSSAENLNKLRNGLTNGALEPAPGNLRKSASGRTDVYSGRSEHTAVPMRSRSKTTSIITTSTNSSRTRSSGKLSDKIKVCIRKRPLNRKEKNSKESDIIEMVQSNQCHVLESKISVDLTKFVQKHCFVFDAVFNESTNNDTVYQYTAKPLVDWMFQGNKATCFAYGQTGSGKTYTVVGTKSVEGLVLLAARDVFANIKSQKYGDDLGVFVSFYEIYCGQLFDLINKRKRLTALENAKKAICIVGLEERQVHSHSDVFYLVSQGGIRRSSGSTSVNSESSRSHAILQMELKNSEGKSKGKFSFIDLAGSERAADVSDTNKQTRYEGAEINTSLLALKECIRALDQESKHTPFRQSKLTQVLRDSFIGNSKTCMIASISPNISSCEDTLNTLRYADRVKELGKDDVSKPADPVYLTNGNHNTSNHGNHNSSNHGNNVDDSFNSLFETSDLAGGLPSDISLVSRTDESDVSFISAHDTSDQCDGKDVLNSTQGSPASSTERHKQSDKQTYKHAALPQSSDSTVYVYPKPPATAPPKYDYSPINEAPEAAWMERSRTMATAPRSRIVASENKMKKAQEDLVASHQIHISQVTNLCSIEAELLQNYEDGYLEFPEYMKKLETILESKNKCVESLRAQVACYSLRATY